MIEIKKDVPVPKKHSNGRPSKYPFAKMEPGDMFVVNRTECKSALSTASRAGKSLGMKFLVRDIGEGMYGIWRTK